MIPIYNAADVKISEVEFSIDLEPWDRNDPTDGSIGRSRGLAQLKSGKFVLIHGTQRPGEKSSAEIISQRMAVQEILKSGNLELFEKYTDLKKFQDEEMGEEKVTEK